MAAFTVVSRVAGLGALTAAGQLLIVGTLPIYSRMFDPAAYGQFIIFVGAYTVIAVIAGLRYDSAIVLPRSDAVAGALAALVMLIGMIVAVLIAVITLAVPSGWLTGVGSAAGAHFGYGLAAATAVGTVQRCRIGWCIRSGRFLSIGLGQFVFCLVSVIAQLSFARVWSPLPALIWGYVCALCLQTAVLSRSGSTRESTRPTTISLRPLRVMARKYRRFPTYMVGYALASSARDRLIQVVLGFGAGASAVGRFGLAYRVAYAPNSLVYSAVSPIFFSIASRGDREAVGRFAAGLVETAFVALVVPYLAFAFEAPVLTDTFLSDKWHGTGPYLQALTGPALLLAATCWLDRAFDCFRRQRTAFILEATFTVVALLVVACLSRVLRPTSVAWVFGSIAACYYWIYFLCTFMACRLPLSEFRRACVNSLVGFAIAIVACGLVHRLSRLAVEVPLYAIIAVAVVGNWMRFLGGADVLRMLIRSRIDSRSP